MPIIKDPVNITEFTSLLVIFLEKYDSLVIEDRSKLLEIFKILSSRLSRPPIEDEWLERKNG
jgi:hypothetical protein